MQPKLIIPFSDLTESNFLVGVQTISTALHNNASFPLPWPVEVLEPKAIATRVTAYQTAFAEAKDGDRTKIKVRQAARVSLTRDLKKVAAYLEIAADGDVSKLASSGYTLRNDIVRSTAAEPLPAMSELELNRGALGGVLLVHARAQANADVYNVQIASADPSVEASWTDAGTYKHCNRIALAGLTPHRTYYVRIRGFNKNGYGVWATSAGLLVL